MAPMRNSTKYQLAKIVDVRKAINPDDEDYPSIMQKDMEESKILENKPALIDGDQPMKEAESPD